jgi:nitroreductase
MRNSCRSYDDRIIGRHELEKILEIMKDSEASPFGSSIRFMLISSEPDSGDELRDLGTYGVVRNPAEFIIGAVNSAVCDLIDFGFCMEKIVLGITDLDIGTCWLGGSFNKSAFSKRINAGETETVPAVVSVGYPARKRTIVDRLNRKMAGSKSRKSWEELFFLEKFDSPLSEDEAGVFKISFEAVRLAPSASNKQPWKILFERKKTSCHFYMSPTLSYGQFEKPAFRRPFY